MAVDAPDHGATGETTGCCSNAQQDIVLSDDTLTSTVGNALNFENVSHMTILSSTVDGSSTYNSSLGGTQIYNVTEDDVNYVNDMIDDTPASSGSDNSGVNLDNHLTQVRFRGDYFRNNAGSPIEYTENPNFANSTSSTNSQQEISDSAFSMNSTWNNCNYYGDIDSTYSPEATGTIQDNLYYDTPQTCNTFAHVNPAYWTLTDNDSVGSDADLSSAPYQFNGIGNGPWSYEYWDGSTTQPMTYDNTSNRWSYGGASIGQFDTLPSACEICWAMRSWQAPRSGTIQIRGWALKNTTGGDGARLQINQNSTAVWGPETLGANDQVGFGTTLTLTVNQGDVIHFMVDCGFSTDNTDDTVSWAPSIGYTSASSAAPVGDWPLNDGSGTTAADVSGNGDNGTLAGGAGWTSGPVTGTGAVTLDGNSQYVSMPDSGDLSGMSQLTVSAWVNLSSLPPSGDFYDLVGKDDSVNYSYRILVDSNGLPQFAVATTNNAWYTAGTVASWGTGLSTGTWYHLVGTYDGTSVSLYVDGVLAGTGSQDISGPIVSSTATPLELGGSPVSIVPYANADISQVEVYNQALSSQEVAALYQLG